jgi:hypothetical protein
MPIEMLTYAGIAERLGCSSEAARALVKRLRLPRQRANNGKARVAIDLAEVNHTPMVRTVTTRSPDDHQAVAATLKARIETIVSQVTSIRRLPPGNVPRVALASPLRPRSCFRDLCRERELSRRGELARQHHDDHGHRRHEQEPTGRPARL